MDNSASQSTFCKLHRPMSLSIIFILAVFSLFERNFLVAQTKGGVNASTPEIEQTTTLKAHVRRVNLDVVVTDSHGRPVPGLIEQDFSISEDGAPQPIRSFTSRSLSDDAVSVAPKTPALPSDTFVNLSRTSEAGAPTVILFDALHMTKQDRERGQRELLEFLKRRQLAQSMTQLAIFGLSDRLYLLQGFNDEVSPSQLQKAFDDLVSAGYRNMPVTEDQSVERMLKALTEIGRFLAPIPGRKNLIWYSCSFPESFAIYYQSPYFTQLVDSGHFSEEIRRATDLLNLSHVAVDPVDIRGVRTDRINNAASNRRFSQSPIVYSATVQAFSTADAATRSTMDSIAAATGGQAFYSTNDLQEALGKAIVNGSTYYSLTYEPTNPKYDGSLRHIKVTLKKPGYNLAYRRTYYADDLAAVAHAAADAPESPLTPALERGTPLAHGLFVEAHLDIQGAPVAATPAQMQVLSQYEAMRNRDQKPSAKTTPVMMQQYVISYALIARQLDLPADDNSTRKAALEFGVISYDEDGRKLNGLDSHVEETIPPARYEKLTAEGYRAVQTIAIPVTAASLRLAVRDIHSNRTASLEVRLPLATASLANPAK